MKKDIDITEAELQVMQVLWKKNPLTAKALLMLLETEWHLKTLNTLLSRLVNKGILSYSKSGREYLYTPMVEQESYAQQQSKRFLHKVFDGQFSPFVAHFAKHESLKEDDIQALKQLIDDWEKDND
ncbi:BlaI/MecI/CopY family transcriptional regulator [Thalassotalea sediminis]|uniref:BlaI/MecI/CopY family transcriptional regulator n=1 Tax=Thalassotalea sediminis TaxID=1759089 RepID=UPI002573B19F|nr:BlaI/MecI/CopY family transcriptional regulator [Thalassotalea sediminis]